ncbi:PTS transporter subunit EIIC [Actinosynnema pretiosum subsp. pretiosum]|uniref:Protein-N(Pi)-phosphohistidine--sugarphosphotran sferase n=2 Tax=Actinosynnema TaxID=40566 RepID=C6W909_ACTMD|nr:PTS transporter subunit EIIC [Actinosynnema mirum]ACU39081.1 Protein-N(pi)-phosphohistidine--sugarphosphotran sferase [Actinosynnema mirum DSM 43827]AXX32677.1 PTS system, N-acetylglucosamine-specific IIB component [Actinosynnema pretiosum subsp. pretiosum]QUF03437.1 PTS transporter subunit EIIC [Actinosynnema pretiosum subsp. pretiosum]
MSASAPQATGGREIKGLAGLQRFGRSLMLPIAALPVAGLLLRLGQPDLLGADGLGWIQVAAVIGGAGDALFTNLPLLFAVGVAIGFARRGDGSTALASVVGYVVIQAVFKAMSPFVLDQPNPDKPVLINYSVLAGVIVGLITAVLWQRYHRIKLPPYLAFFGGRRFVPILVAGVMVVLGVLLGLVYPLFNAGLTWLGEAVSSSTILGAGIYGTVNRLLIPLGLHHIPNTFVWQVFGEYEGKTGDIQRFFAGDPTAGTFQTGFFPIFMFALPAAALAIVHTARPAQKKVVAGIMGSAALTAFITGVTEPLEFAFMFVAWPLYLIHAVLTGTSMAISNALGIRDGFSFSAGAIDYALNFNIAEKPLLIIVLGLVYAVVYYFLFRFVITKWNLRTPGRDEDEDPEADPSVVEGARPEGRTEQDGTRRTKNRPERS